MLDQSLFKFFFSSRRRHTSGALVTGVQTCALPILSDAGTPLISDPGYKLVRDARAAGRHIVTLPGPCAAIAGITLSGLPSDRFLFAGFLPNKAKARADTIAEFKSEERRVGKECVSTCRSRWSPYH